MKIIHTFFRPENPGSNFRLKKIAQMISKNISKYFKLF